ncbi:hypothetical protein BDQ17DRAFT_1434314 [Cyathus striatus]|nr:hypothetical protein BDQ17DRAFT_1434314 [Cyathus striatus]
MKKNFNDNESSAVFLQSKYPLQIQEEEIDFENYDLVETTPHKLADKRGISESPDSPTMSFSSKVSRRSLSHHSASSQSTPSHSAFRTSSRSSISESDKLVQNELLHDPMQFQNFMRQFEYISEEDDMSLDLQGASKITGGHSHQNAIGDNYNIGDSDTTSEIASNAILPTGTLYIYNDF